jgi:hypothetical protein
VRRTGRSGPQESPTWPLVPGHRGEDAGTARPCGRRCVLGDPAHRAHGRRGGQHRAREALEAECRERACAARAIAAPLHRQRRP